jgi:hypothetical protein
VQEKREDSQVCLPHLTYHTHYTSPHTHTNTLIYTYNTTQILTLHKTQLHNSHAAHMHHARTTQHQHATPTTPTHHHLPQPLIYCREEALGVEEWHWSGEEWSWERYVVSSLFLHFSSPLLSIFSPPSFYLKYNKKRGGEIYLDSPPFSNFFRFFFLKALSQSTIIFF